MTPLEKAVEASTRFSLTYSHDGWRLYDNDVRVEGPWSGDDYILAHEVLSTTRAKAAITAFLEAAAEDEDVRSRVEKLLAYAVGGNRMPHMSGDPRNRLSPGQRRACEDAAHSAILALKETING